MCLDKECHCREVRVIAFSACGRLVFSADDIRQLSHCCSGVTDTGEWFLFFQVNQLSIICCGKCTFSYYLTFAVSVYNMVVMWTANVTNPSANTLCSALEPSLNIFSTRSCVYVYGLVLMSAYLRKPRTKEVSFSYATRRVFIDYFVYVHDWLAELPSFFFLFQSDCRATTT